MHSNLPDTLPIHLISDQPCTCPLCGARTLLLWEDVAQKLQKQRCPDEACGYVFLLEDDEEMEAENAEANEA